jgi:tetratricopeptide (TPR) repeat protein
MSAERRWQDMKQAGNECFQTGEFLKAAAQYSTAIKLFDGDTEELAILHRYVTINLWYTTVFVGWSASIAACITATMLGTLHQPSSESTPPTNHECTSLRFNPLTSQIRCRKSGHLRFHTCCSNRCAALLKVSKVTRALSDAQKCIELRPDWEKGYFRKGSALEAMSDLQGALEVYLEGSHRSPNNKELSSKAARLETLVKKANAKQKASGKITEPEQGKQKPRAEAESAGT